ncbi:S66 peptidase family protein [Paenibacillus sp. sgz500958]|uniref:S66 family peptidase n=1 Tax=Paenibacillus sp. sgz500958 TaxID=3242475 RepID=UPI0036D3D7AA
MIRYPHLEKGTTVGVTAPSSGVSEELHDSVKLACSRLKAKGYNVVSGGTVWTHDKAKSAPARIRAAEFNEMMQDDSIGLIFPPWGGELLIEILEFIDFKNAACKWIMGYSDTSVLLLAITLNTGIATAHGTNLMDVRGEHSDETTAMWESVLSTPFGESILQRSSPRYQKEWRHSDPSSCVFHLTEPTKWKVISEQNVHIQGRLLGGCIDVIRHLIGTPFGNVRHFQEKYINNEPVVWVLENCELSATDLRRSLVHMKLAGWLDHCTGLIFGRSSANQTVQNYTAQDVYKDLADELGIPVVYDVDCGHVPPQITFINGAYAEIEVNAAEGTGTVKQYFNP